MVDKDVQLPELLESEIYKCAAFLFLLHIKWIDGTSGTVGFDHFLRIFSIFVLVKVADDYIRPFLCIEQCRSTADTGVSPGDYGCLILQFPAAFVVLRMV